MSGLGLTFLRRGGLTHPTAGNDYIKFKDEAVFNILMAKGVSSDGVGITKDDALRVTDIAQWFRGSSITEFPELVLFENVTRLNAYAFLQTPTLAMIDVSNIKFFDTSCLTTNGEFQLIIKPEIIESLNGIRKAFGMPPVWRSPNLTSLGDSALRETDIKIIEDLGKITSIGANAFSNSTYLTKVVIPATCASIGQQSFSYCKALDVVISHNATPPTAHSQAFMSTNSTFLIYVPDTSVDAYKAATTWSGYASRIKPLSEFNG